MTGGHKLSAVRWALLAATGALMVGAVPAGAADLGGNCCSDLEERIAELEATTARKGNRKVSLTVSGWVNEAVFFWDDGVEQNVYVGTNSLEQTRVKFSGEAKIDKDWSAGYTLELGINGAGSSGFSAETTNSLNNITVRKSSWFLKSKTLGKLTVGQDGMSTYHLLDDADGANTRNYSDAEAAAVALGAFRVRSNGNQLTSTGAVGAGSLTWRQLMGGFNNGTPGQDGRRNLVKYDSPEFQGFTLSAAWGEDDMWDTAATYKGEVGDFKILAKVGYGESSDEALNPCNGNFEAKCQWWGGAGTIKHAPTGIYVYAGYGENELQGLAANLDANSTTWFVQGGIEQKWLPLGKTTLFGEYRHDDTGALFRNSAVAPAAPVLANRAQSSDLNFWAFGAVQNIDAAAMDLYVIYRKAEGSFVRTNGATVDLDDFDMVITGARIQF